MEIKDIEEEDEVEKMANKYFEETIQKINKKVENDKEVQSQAINPEVA